VGGKKQTIGYWFKYLLHYGWCRGDVDAVLEYRVGDRAAWSGRLVASARVFIDKLNLFGGEKGEGGVQGMMAFMFGEPTQAPNAYLVDQLGEQNPAYRGKLTTVFEGGLFGAINPYPKASSLKVERILADWPDDTPWYPEKAAISVATGIQQVLYEDLALDAALADTVGTHGVTIAGLAPSDVVSVTVANDATYTAWSRWPSDDSPDAAPVPWECSFRVRTAEGAESSHLVTRYANAEAAHAAALAAGPVELTGSSSYLIWLYDDILLNRGGLSLRVTKSPSLRAMNPAHMLYESVVQPPELGGMGEPAAQINDASFRAAADRLFDEGFGLCTTWEGEESAEEFQERILNIIGARLNQSRSDGQYYLDLIRDDYVLDDLPVITEPDVLDFAEEPTDIAASINQVIVNWYDPQAKEPRATAPVTSLGGVQAVGGVIARGYTHREIPGERLALIVAGRYLAMNGRPLSRYTLTTNRRPWKLRPGKFFRLQMPSEGIADVVCLAGDIDYGELTNGRMKVIALQDVFGLPSASFVEPQIGTDGGTAGPAASAHQVAFEAPYIELVAGLSTADLNALAADAGFTATAATRPPGFSLNYSIYARTGAAEYQDGGTGEWCAGAAVVEAANPIDTAFTLTGASDLDDVEVGSWALWDGEIVRVDAIDAAALTVTLGRGCADTVPVEHAAGERIYFAGDVVATDRREYVAGEVVDLKLLTRSVGDELALDAAPTQSVAMDTRYMRPYPPGRLRLNGDVAPAAIDGLVTVTWVHRDRVLQADQLVDADMASVGPEPGTTYDVAWYVDDALDGTATGLTGTSHAFTPTADGALRVEVSSARDGLTCWQVPSVTAIYGSALAAYADESGSTYVDADGTAYLG
jgi:hypothetical protein